MTDDNTPAETPTSKSSQSFRPDIESCPCCHRLGSLTGGVQCWFCSGGRVVSKEKADEWRRAHATTDPAPEDK